MATVPSSASRLDTRFYTLAEMFKDNGYATGHFGKWHLGHKPYSPLQHGFDVDVPHWAGPGPAGSYVAPWRFPDFDPQTPNQHIEDRMAKEAVAFMEKHKSEPFFLNYWMFSVHAPFDAKQDLITQYKKKVDSRNPQRSPTYAAMIESMDDAIGTLLDTLDRLGVADNTIIVFASDNGGNMYNEVDGTTPTSNFPLRGGKASMYEGGVRGPAIVVQPGMVKPHSLSDEVIQSGDFYPTLLEMLTIEPRPNQIFDGISIVPALSGKALPREAIFTYFPHDPPVPEWIPPSVSVHQHDWKLIRIFHGGEDGKHRYQLFNLKEDLGENHNLASANPDRVRTMDTLIEAFLHETGAVLPTPNPNFDPAKYKPELEGKGRIRTGKRSPSSKKTGNKPSPIKPSPIKPPPIKPPPIKPLPNKLSPHKPVFGWLPGGTSELSFATNTLVVKSTGGDPYLRYQFPKPISNLSLTLKLTMASNSAGKAYVFWHEKNTTPAFSRDRSKQFEVLHDEMKHDYSVNFSTEKPIVGIRIDPSSARGQMVISKMLLTSDDGTVLHEWSFGN